MTTNTNAVSKIGRVIGTNPDTEEGNKNKEDAGTGYIPTTVKNWIVIPLLCFHVAGFVVLCVLAATFLDPERDTSHYQWALPALIVAFAGLPFAFASNFKTLVNSLTVGN